MRGLLIALCALVLASCTATSGGRGKKDASAPVGGGDSGGFTPGTDGTVGLGDTGVIAPDAGPGSADTGGVDGTDASDSSDPVQDVIGPDTTAAPDIGTGEILDLDKDGVDDDDDNCLGLANATQENMDGDNFGDDCDPDRDGDGVEDAQDCAPYDDAVTPGIQEVCNGIDDNCDTVTDGPDSVGCLSYFADADGDGTGAPGTGNCLCAPLAENDVPYSGDCNEANPQIGPLVAERCNGVDDNCNLLVDDGCDDDGDDYCDATLGVDGAPAVCPLGPGDCIDFSASVNPGVAEVNDDNIDNNCDGVKGGEDAGPITPNCSGLPCTGATADAFLCSMELCYPGLVGPASAYGPFGDDIFGAWGAIGHFGNPGNDLKPFAGTSYAMLSSGTVPGDTHVSLGGGSAASDPYSPKDSFTSMQDVVEFKVTLTAPQGATGFSLDYVFMSAEYEEYIGTQFNDKFYVVLNGPQTTPLGPKVINFTKCSDPNAYFDYEEAGQKYCFIAINTAFSEQCGGLFGGTPPDTDISGTGYECDNGSSTGWLTTQWPIGSGETFDLLFHIHDTSDQNYDSLVLIDNFRWLGGTFQKGTASHN